MINVGIIGHGFMGQTHEAAFQALAARGVDCSVRLVTMDDVLADADIHAVSICTPTDTHLEIATAALNAGKHVLLEKPVSLRSGEIPALNLVAERAQRICMPAHCMRFWPGWPYLRDVIRARTYGALKRAHFRRITRTPDWNPEFYLDLTRSGGALYDLHVHDVDFILWCLGQPGRVTCEGDVYDVTATYAYGDAIVIAEGAWRDDAPGFHMSYEVEMERATLEFVHDRSPALLLTIGGGVPEPVKLDDVSAYEMQAENFIDAVAGRGPPGVTLQDARQAIRQIEKEALLMA